jgi:hypothetical protein
MSAFYRFIEWARAAAPSPLRSLVRGWIPITGTAYDKYRRRQSDPFRNEAPDCCAPGSAVTLGIFGEPAGYHVDYVRACRELGVSYRLLDLFSDDWIAAVEESGCDAFLVFPSSLLTVWKEMFDDRLRILAEDLGRTVYPSLKELWLYENKRRCRDWMIAHGVPHPRTWVFYDAEEAEQFACRADLPLVYKTSLGACAQGVRILRTPKEARRLVRRAFRRGVIHRGADCRDKQWGSVYLQEYLPNVNEWRMVRIGGSYFGYRKERRGDFHSGSRRCSWPEVPRQLLELLREGPFDSMAVDVFETDDGRLLVNELQTLFGTSHSVHQLKVNGVPGRYLHDEQAQAWVFEAGDFSRNSCANLRVQHLTERIVAARE